MGSDDYGRKHECCDDLRELLRVTFRVTFRVDADIDVVALDCLGPCPPTTAGDN